jgi:hypothetical protein
MNRISNERKSKIGVSIIEMNTPTLVLVLILNF